MKLELNRTHMTGYETVLDTTVFCEETLETIVPDANLDILRLIDTQGKAFLKSKEAMDGRVTLTGTARLTVLYQPEGGTGPCKLEVGVPFSVSVEDRGLTSNCLVTAVARVAGVDTRTINPRKILTRVEVAVSVRVFCAKTTILCTGVHAEGGSVEEWKEVHRLFCISAVQEKQVTFEDNLSIPAGHSAAEELICDRVALTCHEAKLIGNKLIFKGDAVVRLLYRPVGGGMDAAEFTMPFSQVAEVIGVGENGHCLVDVALNGAEFSLGADGRTISASLSMLAQIVVREEREVELLADTYSVCCSVSADRVPYKYRARREAGVGRQTVRQLIETGLSVQSVVDVYCLIGQTEQKREGNQTNLCADVILTAVCMTEEGDYCAMSRSLEMVCPVEVPEDRWCSFECRCGDLVAMPTAGGVEVRFLMELPYFCEQEEQGVVVQDVRVEEEGIDTEQRKPSIVLRLVQSGESLWEVAKRYGTTTEDIVHANELEGRQLGGEMLLLIPRKR